MIKRFNVLIKSQTTHIHFHPNANQCSSYLSTYYPLNLTSISKQSISFWNKTKPQTNKLIDIFEYTKFSEFLKENSGSPINKLLLVYIQTQIQEPKAHEIFSAASQILRSVINDDPSNLASHDLRTIAALITHLLQDYKHHLYFDQMELITSVIVILHDQTVITQELLKSFSETIQNRLLEISNNKKQFLYFKGQATKILKNLTLAGYVPSQQLVSIIALDTFENFKETPNTLLIDVVFVQSKSMPNSLQLYNETKLHLLKGSQFYLKEKLTSKFTIDVKDKGVRQILRELGTKLLLQSYRREEIQYRKIIVMSPLNFSNLLSSYVNIKDRSSNFAAYLQERVLETLRENEDIVVEVSDQYKLFWINLLRFLRYTKTEGIVLTSGNGLEDIAWNYFVVHVNQLNLWDYQFLLEFLLKEKESTNNVDLKTKSRRNLLFQLMNTEIQTKFSSEISEQQLRILIRLYHVMLDIVKSEEKEAVQVEGLVNYKILKPALDEFILNFFQSRFELVQAKIILEEKLDEVNDLIFKFADQTHLKWKVAAFNIKQGLESGFRAGGGRDISPLNLLQATDYLMKCAQHGLVDVQSDEELRQALQIIESQLNQTPIEQVNEEFSKRYFKSYSQAVELKDKQFQKVLEGLLNPLLRFFADKYSKFGTEAFQNVVIAMGDAELLDVNFDDGSQLYDKSIKEEIKEYAVANQKSYEEIFVKRFYEEIFKQESLTEKAMKFSEEFQKKLS